ncbi:MAG: hypothetical protein ACD_76C00045G0012 [uncultured bacterium]|nr:MAG: hypothetical protein ACD_76C00045G0012 [uncultured bacterium]HBD05220.1 hypothetical protein [Candidatus Uhrbacteria bacterium]
MAKFGDRRITGNPETGSPEAEGTRHKDYDLIFRKFLISRYATGEKLGSQNLYLAGKNLYASLYHPENIDSLIDLSEKFPDRIDIMKSPLSSKPETIPTEDEFVKEFRKILTRGIDYDKCISEAAREQLSRVAQLSEQTVIWTEGDSAGVPEKGLPGSREQLYKIAGTRIYDIRKDIAKDRNAKRSDVILIVAEEGKMRFITDVVKSFHEKQISTIIIIEDRLQNIIQAIEMIKKQFGESVDVFPVWVRQSEFKDKTEDGKSLEECLFDYNAIDSISELMMVLDKNNLFSSEHKVGSIFDLDGVLLDDEKRRELQISALVAEFQKNGWI